MIYHTLQLTFATGSSSIPTLSWSCQSLPCTNTCQTLSEVTFLLAHTLPQLDKPLRCANAGCFAQEGIGREQRVDATWEDSARNFFQDVQNMCRRWTVQHSSFVRLVQYSRTKRASRHRGCSHLSIAQRGASRPAAGYYKLLMTCLTYSVISA